MLHHAEALFYLFECLSEFKFKFEFIWLEFELEIEIGNRFRNRKEKLEPGPFLSQETQPARSSALTYPFPRTGHASTHGPVQAALLSPLARVLLSLAMWPRVSVHAVPQLMARRPRLSLLSLAHRPHLAAPSPSSASLKPAQRPQRPPEIPAVSFPEPEPRNLWAASFKPATNPCTSPIHQRAAPKPSRRCPQSSDRAFRRR